MIVIIEKIISIKHKQKACTSMIVIIEKIISIKHKNKINIRTIRKGTKYYSIYKTLPFAHIGMTDFPSRSPKYIC
jgi:hypothetical protein